MELSDVSRISIFHQWKGYSSWRWWLCADIVRFDSMEMDNYVDAVLIVERHSLNVRRFIRRKN